MLPVRLLRSLRYRPMIRAERRFYDGFTSEEAIRDWQLARLAESWRRVRTNVPHYRELVASGAAPEEIDSWETFQQLPIVGRSEVQERTREMTDPSRPPFKHTISGGSTGQPTRLPAWDSERRVTVRNFWLGRSWTGINAADRLFVIWGHSHKLGSGWRGKLKRVKRNTVDTLFGYGRASAYEVGESGLRETGEAILRFRPDYLVGYSVTLDLLAAANESRSDALAGLKMKGIIATAEGFPRPGSRALIERVFGCPVVMEYGTVETGPLAYETPGGGFRAFWRYFLLEAEPSRHIEGGHELLVSSLYPRCFPLVRYRVGDLIEAPMPELSRPTVTRFDSVLGRVNDVLNIDGSSIHSLAVSVAIKTLPGLRGYQIYISSDNDITFRVETAEPIDESAMNRVRELLSKSHPKLGLAAIERVAALEKSVAGKTPVIVRKSV